MANQPPILPAVVTIADLPAGTTVTGAELIEAVQTLTGTLQSVQLTLSQAVGAVFPINLGTPSNLTGVLPAANTTSHFFPDTALTSGGTATLGLTLSSAVALGVFAGTGAPTFAAGTGSLYINAGAANATTRFYINTDGLTSWASFTASS